MARSSKCRARCRASRAARDDDPGPAVITKLENDLRREIDIDGVPHVVTLSRSGFLLTVKGRRKGLEIAWKDLVSGDAALATALNASLTANVGWPAATKAAVPARKTPRATAGKAPTAPSAGTKAKKRETRR